MRQRVEHSRTSTHPHLCDLRFARVFTLGRSEVCPGINWNTACSMPYPFCVPTYFDRVPVQYAHLRLSGLTPAETLYKGFLLLGNRFAIVQSAFTKGIPGIFR